MSISIPKETKETIDPDWDADTLERATKVLGDSKRKKSALKAMDKRVSLIQKTQKRLKEMFGQ